MKTIILQTTEEFELLQDRIHQSFLQNILNYQGERYANPITNVTTGELALMLELEGIRGAIILGFVLTDVEKQSIIEISQDDENWFPKRDLGLPTEGI